MTKNKLEKLFSGSKHQLDWCIKLHNNPLAHQNTPADYIASHKNKVLLIECKQVTCDEDGSGRLAFKRLKQTHDMLNFMAVNHERHRAFFCIGFYDRRWDNSEVYIIPVKLFVDYIDTSNKVSINRTEMKKHFGVWQIKIERGELKLLQ